MEAQYLRQNYTVEIATDPQTGRIVEERWRDQHGRLDRPNDLPAHIEYCPETGEPVWLRWFREGMAHRDGDKPAEIVIRPTTRIIVAETYSILNQIHRDGDKPAVTYRDDKGRVKEREYFRYGEPHRDLGPAVERLSVVSGKLLSGEYWTHGVRRSNPSVPTLEPY